MKKHSLLFTLLAILMVLSCFATGCQPVSASGCTPTPTTIPTPIPTPAPTPIKRLPYIKEVGHVNKVLTPKTENISIKFDADVKVPDTKTFPIVELVPKKITQEQVDNFIDTFFPEPEHVQSWWHEENKPFTKKEIRDQIVLREKWIKSTKKLTPKGSKGKSIHIEKWEKQIEQYKEFLKDAPNDESEIVLPDATKFAVKQPSNRQLITDRESFEWELEIAERDKKYNVKHINYSFIHKDKNNEYQQYQVSACQSERPQDNRFHFYASEKDCSPFRHDTIAENYENIPELETTYSEAKNIAEKARNVLGLESMDLYKSSIYKSDYEYELGYIKPGKVFYYFIYTWDVDATNATYTVDYYSSSYFYILIDDSGIVSASYHEPAEYRSTFPKKVEFLPFDAIIDKAYDTFNSEEYLYNRFVGNPITRNLEVKNYNVVIEKVELGYMMVKGYSKEGKNYTLVPVWDFFGREDYYYSISFYDNDDPYKNKTSDKYCTHRSLLTINAINGQVIDRDDNYWRD